ncbi:MAG: ATP-binding protein [Desulfuromonadaceae bacterium]
MPAIHSSKPTLSRNPGLPSQLRWFGHILLPLLLLFCSADPARANIGPHQHVLILHSYHPGFPWTDEIMAGMQQALQEKIGRIQLHVEYLDTRRYLTTKYFTAILDAILHSKLEGRSFDLVLLSDNEALTFALGQRNKLFADTPMVFCGINNFSPDLISGFHGLTGVAEIPAFAETIQLARRLHPASKTIVVIGNTHNPTDRENRAALLNALQESWPQISPTLWDNLPLEALTTKLAQLPDNALVFLTGSITDPAGHILPEAQSIRQLRQVCPAPLYSFWDSALGQGIVGGKLVSANRQGQLAGRLALQILAGRNPDELAVIHTDSTAFLFDYNELRRFDVPLSALPAGSTIINQPPPFYALSKQQLWSGLGLMTVFTGFLLLTILGRRRAERDLRKRERQIKLLLNSTAEGIYGLDLMGNCIFCNPAGLQLLGYAEEKDLLGKNMHLLTHHTRPDASSYPQEECLVCQAYRQDEKFHVDDEIFWRADGSSFPAEYWAHPLRKEQKPIGVVVSFLDITERKEAQERLQKTNRELDAFVYTVSHDLRVPISAIMGFAELLQEEHAKQLDEDGRHMLTVIERQGRRMGSLLEDLLALARVGRLERPDQPVDTNEILSGVLLELGGQITDSGSRIQSGLLPGVRVPETLLAQIFQNLLTNAVRYAGGAGMDIEVGGELADERTRFFVRDHGPGIPAEERLRIFDTFYRGSTGATVAGSGVGLATVQKIAQLYSGQSWVEETPGGGATFWVELTDKT